MNTAGAEALAESPACMALGSGEGLGRRVLYLLLAIGLCAAFFVFHHAYWAPADGGVDQNGYLVGGKMIASRGTPRLDLVSPVTGKYDPLLFVGSMWIGSDIGKPTERYYPKYPIGYPALVAAALRLGGARHGIEWAYLINPVAMTAAMLGCFLLVRMVAGSLLGVLTMVALMTNPVVLALTNNNNSHATAIFCVTWGMWLLIGWWAREARGGWLRGAAGGFLLGYAVTIRYTEGLLLLPLALAILMRWADARRAAKARGERSLTWGDWRRLSVPLVAWGVPVLVLVGFNVAAMGALTGYDPTNESSGFRWEFFRDNWPNMLNQLNTMGLFIYFPLGLAGMLAMAWWNRGLALLLAAWIVPNIIIYSLYYWAPDGTNTGYLRFFLTIFPGMLAAAAWLLGQLPRLVAQGFDGEPAGDEGGGGRGRGRGRGRGWTGGWPLLYGTLTALVVLFNLMTFSLDSLAGQQRQQLNLARMQMEVGGFGNVPAAIPPGSVVISSENILHQLQFNGDYVLYSSNAFRQNVILRWKDPNPDDPQPFQPQRAEMLYNLLKNSTDADVLRRQLQIAQAAIEGGRRVFLIVSRNELKAVRLRFSPPQKLAEMSFDVNVVAAWNDPNVGPRRSVTPLRIQRRQQKQPPGEDPRNSVVYIAEVRQAS